MLLKFFSNFIYLFFIELNQDWLAFYQELRSFLDHLVILLIWNCSIHIVLRVYSCFQRVFRKIKLFFAEKLVKKSFCEFNCARMNFAFDTYFRQNWVKREIESIVCRWDSPVFYYIYSHWFKCFFRFLDICFRKIRVWLY